MTVVFDGYGDTTKIVKAGEQCRRTTKTSSTSDIIFDQFMKVPANQQLLANIHNKSRFISMPSDMLITENIAVKQAQNDAEVLIIETTIEQFNATNTIVVVGEDVDLLILTDSNC